MIDFVKNTEIKNNYTEIGQRATQSALIEQNGVGGLLGTQSANQLIDEYMLQTRGHTINGVTNKTQTRDSAGFRQSSCARDTNTQYPKITISYDSGLHTPADVNLLAKNGKVPTVTTYKGNHVPNGALNPQTFASTPYRTITAQIQDVSDNYFGGFIGQPCQVYNISVSSVSTNSDDLNSNSGN